MTRRNGITLIEVLVAIFIMGVGLLAILTLFPLGAFNMARAVRDGRSAEMAAAADGYFRAYWKTEVVEKGGAAEAFFQALDNPDPTNTRGLPNAASDSTGYPVFVDPMGHYARPPIYQDWLGDNGGTNVPRRTIEGVKLNGSVDPDLVFRICSQWDGIGWDDDNQKITKDREVRYNWLAVVQRRDTNDKDKKTAYLTIVVFDRRIHLSAKTGDELVFPNVVFTPATTSLTIPNANPDLRAGGWVLDATVLTTVRPGGTGYVRHANFYRVVSANFDGMNTQVELQTPIKPPTDGNTAAYSGTLVILHGVSGVYDRRLLSPDQ